MKLRKIKFSLHKIIMWSSLMLGLVLAYIFADNENFFIRISPLFLSFTGLYMAIADFIKFKRYKNKIKK